MITILFWFGNSVVGMKSFNIKKMLKIILKVSYDTYINNEDHIEINFLSYAQEVEQKVDNHVFNESPQS
jgi:hypothetical protein